MGLQKGNGCGGWVGATRVLLQRYRVEERSIAVLGVDDGRDAVGFGIRR
jgi:hypothetical protein